MGWLIDLILMALSSVSEPSECADCGLELNKTEAVVVHEHNLHHIHCWFVRHYD